jgi:predicted GNAT superfamily acetyltransferase
MKIAPAKTTDIGGIKKIYEFFKLDVSRVGDPNYCNMVQQRGFTVSTGSSDDLGERLNSSTLLNVAKNNRGMIIGYIDISKEEYFPESADDMIWLSKTAKQKYYHSDKAITLHHIASSSQNKGTATKLYYDAENRLKNSGYKYIFSIVTTSPLTNLPSIAWHTKNGFKRVCTHPPINLFGLKNYQSVLFCKKI